MPKGPRDFRSVVVKPYQEDDQGGDEEEDLLLPAEVTALLD